MRRVLFICKHRSSYGVSYGLINSARFVAEALGKLKDVEAKVVDVVDNNAIDREVHLFKPTHVIIEALWVVPSKFPELLKLHQNVHWFVRIHSMPTFIANEGIAMEWLAAYSDLEDQYDNFTVASNNDEFADVLSETFSYNVVYTPNIYNPVIRPNSHRRLPAKLVNYYGDYIHIGCFGAIRPMKNHLAQALAAIQFADRHGLSLMFHINYDRIEQRGNEVLKNLRALFDRTSKSTLVEHPWMSHSSFLELVSEMDIGMQVSLSETFNIVTADFVSLGIPVVVSSDIKWAPCMYKAEPTSVNDMAETLNHVWTFRNLGETWLARFGLWLHNRRALRQWKTVLAI